MLGALALGQVEHESDTLVPVFFEGRHADQHGNTAAVFPKVLLLKRLQTPGHLQLGQPASYIGVTPFGRRQLRPTHATRDDILMVVADHAEKCVVGLDDPAVEIPDKDADDVGVDQAPNLPFAFPQCLLSPLAFRHVDTRGDDLYKLSACREHRIVSCFDVFDRSIGQYDSELVRKASLFAHCVLDVFVHPV